MSWYGKNTSKELQNLLENKPTFSELLLYPDFLIQLQAFNTKLLDYLSTNTSLFKQAITYVTVPPSSNDSNDRKYKLPLLVVEMVQTETTCVINAFMKEIQQNDQMYFDMLFEGLSSHQILPMLMSYIYRISSVLLKNRHSQVIQRIYKNPLIFNKLLEHTHHMTASNTIQLFFNLDVNKHQTTQQKLKIKQQIANKIIDKIELESLSQKQTSRIENLCGILCETVQKYYLISDGKQIIDIITGRRAIMVMMNLIKNPNKDFSSPAFTFFISLINYYSFSSFNVDDMTTETGKQSLQKLQSQPLISQLCNYFVTALDQIMGATKLNLYLYQLLQVLCHCISISSFKIFQCIKQTNFFDCLITLLFKHQSNNILHKLIEKSFLHIFISDRKIYSQYKKYLFCQMDIIDCTAGKFLRMLPKTSIFDQGKKKHYFGHLMRVLKIYSGIKTVDEDIVNAIKAKSQVWKQITQLVISKYEEICDSKLGSYEKVPEPTYQEFKVNKYMEPTVQSLNNLEEVKKENSFNRQSSSDQMIPFTNDKIDQTKESVIQTNFIDISSSTEQQKNSHKQPELVDRSQTFMSQSNVIDYRTDPKQLKKSQSFQDFMIKSRQEAEQQIQLRRSLSQEKKLSGQRTRLQSKSPGKKNIWKQEDSVIQSATYSEKKPMPRIPIDRKGLSQSCVSESKYTSVTPHGTNLPLNDAILSEMKSHRSLQQLKKIRVFYIDKPAENKYRRVQEKDRVLLQFLGLSN